MAGVDADDVDLAEVHDCFAIAEMIAYEELGFCAKGEGGPFVEKGLSDYGGKVVVNPRGGLIGCGHPLGATGIAQASRGLLAAPRRGRRAPGPGARLAPDPQQLRDGRARRHDLRSPGRLTPARPRRDHRPQGTNRGSPVLGAGGGLGLGPARRRG